jgi:death-on-curing protein
MMRLEEVRKIHQILIERFGGSQGLRDVGILESALSRPFQTFDGLDLYPTAIDKAAALFESIISNHPFVDGNKRTAYVLMKLFLMENGLKVQATQDEKYRFVILCAEGSYRFEEIKVWLTNHLGPKE